MRRQQPVALKTRPRVSVVIPCYNYGRYLPDAVASVLDQDGVDVDVLIVDDASTDGSCALAQELAASDQRIDVLLHEENRGHINTYNDGLAKVTGSYIVLLSADDLVAPNALTRAVALMEVNPHVGLVYGWAESFVDTPPTNGTRGRRWQIWPGAEWLALAARRGRCFVSSPEVVMRREALEQTDGYDPRLPHSADFDMWLRTAARWDIGRISGPAQAFYRVHDGNMHLTTYAGWLTDLEERRRTFDILFDERVPQERAELRRLRPMAKRALAREALRRGLQARRDEADRPAAAHEAAAYSNYALEVDPTVTRDRWWLLTSYLRVHDCRYFLRSRRWLSRARLHLEWRRRRLWGT
jgi:glycosyltransferase involved in cell wall biosynthesis